MKTYILATVAFLLTLLSFSQDGFGVKIGAQQHTFTTKYTDYTNETTQIKKSNQTTLNYSAGIVIRSKSRDSLRRFSSLIELEYATFNTKLSDFREDNTTASNQILTEKDPYESSFQSVNFKFLGGVKIYKKLYVEFGPEFNYILGDDEVIYPETDSETTTNSLKNKYAFNKFRAFGLGGLFYEINKNIGFAVRYHHEILFWKKRNHPTASQDFLGLSSSTIKNNYLSTSLSYYF